ncbi:MAG: immunoglobulin domain-containing protein [Monoglobaceae bacterium]
MKKLLLKLIGYALCLCMAASLLPQTAVFAATEITTVTLTGDITPVANGSCKYLSIPSGANYTVKNYGGMDINYWGDLEKESMITSFASTGIYGYLLAIAPKDGYEFSESVKVTVNGKVLAENVDYSVFADEDDVVVIQIMRGYAIDDGSHVHEADMNSYGAIDEDYHGYKCKTAGCPYVFDVESFKEGHVFSDGICEYCGYKTTHTLPVITAQPENVTKECNKSVTLSVEASGEGLKYTWYYQIEDGLPTTLGTGSPLTIDNTFWGNDSVQYYCKIYNYAGEVYSEKATITVTHGSIKYEEAYEYGEVSSGSDTIYYGATHHRKTCNGCGKFLGYERHSYVNDVCKYCDHVKGTSKAPIPEIELSVPNYYYGVFKPVVYIPSEGAVIDTYQWQGRKIGETEWVDKTNSMLMKGYEYRLKITLKSIPSSEFELKYPWPTVTVGGRECTPHYVVSSNTFTVDLPEPLCALHFNSNGGSGSMTPLTSADGQFFLPECTYTKDGDNFIAWRVNGKLYGVGEQVNVSDTSTAYAVWESEKIIAARLAMTNLYECETPADVEYTHDDGKNYSVESVSWCEGDTYTAASAMDETDKFDMSKNYIAKITLNGFFTADTLDLTVNDQQMTDMVRVSSSKLIVYVRVLNNVEIFFEPPEDGSTLAQKADFKMASDKYEMSTLYWCPTDAYGVANKLSSDTVAVEGTTYYLHVPIKTAENYIFGNNKMKINGKEYEAYENTGIRLIVRCSYAATAPRFKVKTDDNVIFTVTAPEAKTVCFAALFYDKNGKLKRMFVNDSYSLAEGENSMNIVQMFKLSLKEVEIFQSAFTYAEYANVIIWDRVQSMKPLGFMYRYK